MKFKMLTIIAFVTVLTACVAVEYQTISRPEIDRDIVLAKASLASYAIEEAKLKSILDSAGIRQHYLFGPNQAIAAGVSAEFLIASIDNDIVLAFTGTNKETSTIDWEENRDCKLEYLDDQTLKFHNGYIRSWSDIRERVLGELSRINEEEFVIDEIFVTGHSKGGATAMVAAYDLINSGFEISRIVSFGAPPAHEDLFLDGGFGTPGRAREEIAKSEMLTKMDNISVHYKLEGDPVPYVSALLCGFKEGQGRSWNIGKRRSVRSQNGYIESDHYGFARIEELLGSKPLFGSGSLIESEFEGGSFSARFIGHDMAKYLHRIQNARYDEYGN